VFALEGFKMAPADDPGREGAGGVVEQSVDEGGLSREYNEEKIPGIEVHLGKGMELGEDVEPEEVGFIDHEDGNLFLADQIGEHGTDRSKHSRHGIGWRWIAGLDADLAKELHEGT
jgi:hypothetical protein